ncbi:peptidoglycan-binding protein [Streptomyces sp. VRA16 Mangrove soil]|uniref:peptidoglycan-binding domain-containing protein n=1 Tax=Streptomyces sp. VRA16 Mangrove soil TaxID=2817434 RepID=UPI001A9D720B|nr:peptidoglycan-binding domain-containing protein [Streptomyces sp. VRA16 Mangrove soil]MBO1331346.1 peptidoglycan-binding protein [Streptomyces sp. VRA16 Mangrove soil]
MRRSLTGFALITGLLLMPLAGTATPAAAATTIACNYTASEPTLRLGSSGTAVKQLQCQLNRSLFPEKYAPLAVDGSFGARTRDAVYTFQNCIGLSVDGVVGPQTWSELYYWDTRYYYPDC